MRGIQTRRGARQIIDNFIDTLPITAVACESRIPIRHGASVALHVTRHEEDALNEASTVTSWLRGRLRVVRGVMVAVLATTVASVAPAQSPAFPTKPVRLIVPFSPGGSSDMLARFVAKGLQERWKESVVVENKPGASGIIGTEFAAKAPADGYTVLFATISNLAVNPSLFEGRLPYDSVKSFAPVTLAASIPMLLVVNPAIGVTTPAELIARMKVPPPLNYGSGGNGTSQHLAMEMFKQRTGTQATHVPYKSSAPAMVDLLAGQVSLMFDNFNTALPHVKSGRIRTLGITTLKRSPQAPDIPTLAEQGVPGFEMGTWFAFVAPAGTPPDILRKINQDMVAVLTDPQANAVLVEQGMDVIASSPEQLGKHIQDEIAKWAAVVKAANIKVD